MSTYKSNIMLGITLPSESDVKGRLETLIKGLSNQKITLDLTLKDNTIVQTLEKLNSILDVTKQKMGGDISLGNIGSVINTTIQGVEKLNGELQRVSRTNLGDDLYKQTTTMANGIGQVTKEVGVVQKIGDEFNNVGKTINTTTMDLKEYNNALLKIEKAQSSLSNLKLVDANKVSTLSSNLNTKDITSSNELKNLLSQVKELENEEKNLQQIQNQAYSNLANLQKEEYSIKQKLITAEGEYKTKLEESLVTNRLLQTEQSKNIQSNGLVSKEQEIALTNQQIKLQEQLNQAKSKQVDKVNNDNVTKLQQEQELLQKQEQAYQQINVLKANGVINTSEISKLEQLAKSATNLKEINSVLSQIGQTTSRESSISTLTKQIQEAQVKLEQMKSTFGGKLPSGFIQSTEAELNKLLADLKNVDGTNFTGIKNSLNSVKTSMTEVNNETKQLVNSLKESNSGGFFTGITDFLSKAGLFYGVAQVVQEITTQLKNASEYTLIMDKAFTNMQMITGKSKSEISGLVEEYKTLGQQLHTTNVDMMGGMEEITRAGIQGDSGKALMSSSIIGSKMSGQTTQEVTQQLIAIKNAFNMTGESMEGVVDMISKMDNVSATSFKEIAEAMRYTAFSAQEAGTPLSNLITYITTVSEKTRKSASTIGESFKTIYSRYSNIKLGRLDDDGKSINDTEMAMNRIGIAIRTSKGQFKEFDVVLNEFMQKYKNGDLKQVDYLAGIQSLAGTRQRETLMALCENMDTLNTHQEQITQSVGNAKKMFDSAYSDSLDARVNDLKIAFESLYETVLSSDSLKWLVTESTQLITALSNVDGKTIAFIGTIGLATVAMSKLVTVNKTLMAVQAGKEGVVAVGLTNFLGVLTGMTPLLGTTKVATQELVGVQATATLATEALAQAEARALLATEALTAAQEGQATSSFAIAVAEGEVMLATDALTVAQAEAVVATEALAVAEGAVVTESAGLTGVAGAWTLITGGIKSAVVASLSFMATPIGMAITALAIVIGVAGKAWYDYKKHEAEVETQSKSLKSSLEGVNEALKNGDTKGASDQLDKLAESEKKYQDALEKKKKIEKEISDVQDDMKNHPLNSEGDLQYLQVLQGELGDVSKELSTQDEAFKKAGVSAKDYAFAQSEVANAKIADKIKEDTKAQLENRENLEGAKEEYENFIKTTQDLYTEYKNLSAEENLSAEQKTKLSDVCEQLRGKFTDLNVSVDENGVAHINNTPLIEDNISYLSSEGMTVETLTSMRLSDSKACSEWSIGNQQMTYQEISNNIENYKTEIEALSKLSQARAEANFDTSIGASLGGTAEIASEGYQTLLKDELSQAEGAKAKIDSIYGSIKAPVNRAGSGGGGSYSPSGGGSGKSGKSDTEKEAEKAEKLSEEIAKMQAKFTPDVYFELNNAVKGYDNELEVNKALLDSLTEGSADYQKAQLAQIEIDKKKQVALVALNDEQKKQAGILKDYLAQYGFLTDAQGNLTNSQSQIEYWEGITNAMTGSTEEEKAKKQEWIDWISELEKKTSDYSSLVNDKIPSVANQWSEVGNQIKKTAEEMKKANEETLGNFQEKLAGDILEDMKKEFEKAEEETDKQEERAKKAIEDEKSAKAKYWEDRIKALQDELDALDDETANNQEKLKKLKIEKSLWEKDNSVFSKSKILEIDGKIKETEKIIKKDGLSKQIDDLNKQKEEDLKSYDDKIKDQEDFYSKKKEEQKKANDDSLMEEKAYAKANELITSNNQSQILSILSSHAQNYREVGSLLGKNFAQGMQEEVDKAMNAFSGLGGNTTSSISTGIPMIDNIANGAKSIWDKLLNGSSSNSSSSSDIAKFSEGGRTPDNLSDEGALGILHKKERVLNSKETGTIDEILNYVKNSGGLISQLSSQYANPNSYSSPSLVGTNLNGIASNVTNTKNNVSQPININFGDIVNHNGAEANMNMDKIVKTVKKSIYEDGRKYR